MNCSECHQWLQERLDGRPCAEQAALNLHLQACADCRGWHAAARRLEQCLPQLAGQVAPVDIADRIVLLVLDDYRGRLRLRRRLVTVAGVVSALAAGVLVIVLLNGKQPVEHNPALSSGMIMTRETPVDRAPAPDSLRDSVVDAGSAAIELTRRTADETVGQSKLLWPVVSGTPSLDDPADLTKPFDPSARSLREAGQGVTVGLQPVTTSARRAIDLFLREIPPLDGGSKPDF